MKKINEKNREKKAKDNREIGRKTVKKKQKNDVYLLKKNTSMKFLRILLWVMLGFFMVRGIVTLLRPDGVQQVSQMIHDFRMEFNERKEENEEVLGFAQNFAKEYLTYQKGGEKDYRERIRPYVSQNIYRMERLIEFGEDAKAVYVKAYRKEEYSGDQMDVYVMAEVEYAIQELMEDGITLRTNIESRNTILKIPVYVRDGKYAIENLPMFVSDEISLEGYAVEEYYGMEVGDGEKSLIEESLVNFLTAYYTQEQGVINYYLGKDAQKDKFLGLTGRYRFVEMVSLKCFQEEGRPDIVCIPEFRIADINETMLLQKFSIRVRKEEDRYYITDMDIRVGNMK